LGIIPSITEIVAPAGMDRWSNGKIYLRERFVDDGIHRQAPGGILIAIDFALLRWHKS